MRMSFSQSKFSHPKHHSDMKTVKNPNLFPVDVQAEYDRFILERRKREAKNKPLQFVKRKVRRGPDRSGY